jgi:NADH-quinone oxidoreductase subunit J
MNIVFLTTALILAIVALNVKKSIASLIAFALMMFVLGLYYLSLDEKLLGLFQIFVYTGGIAVLMLFGITLIGVEFQERKSQAWSGVLAFSFFVGSVTLFFQNVSSLKLSDVTLVENKALFVDSYSDYVILFALIASSLLYGTIKAMKTLQNTRKKDV